jgi:GntR family transcriptional regulator/MocR family aminotransferase
VTDPVIARGFGLDPLLEPIWILQDRIGSTRFRAVLELAFQPDRDAREPVYRQLERFLRELIQARRLVPGERLPPSRELAASLSLSRNTVNQAYQILLDDGLLRAHVGQGTYVAGRPAPAPEPIPDRAFAWEGLLARRTRALALPTVRPQPPTPRFDLRAGRADLGSLPLAELKRAFGQAAARAAALADEADPRGWLPLRRALSRSLVARGIACTPDEVAITNGAQQALDLVARTLVDPGDAVAIEQPGYFGAALAFSSCEAHLVGVGVDEHGLRTDELARVLRARRVKLLYATPAAQQPTGVSLSEARRHALLALSDEYQLPIVEDDYDSELRHGGPPVPALKHLDSAGRVIYLGTFSKALFAGLRIGYAVAPAALIGRLAVARVASDFNSDVVTQAALCDLLESGALERHVRRVRQLYAARRAALLAQLEARMPEGARWRPPAGGNALWLRLPDPVDVEAFHAGCLAAGIALGSGELMALPEGPAWAEARRHVQLSFARIAEERIEDAVSALARVTRQASRGRSVA